MYSTPEIERLRRTSPAFMDMEYEALMRLVISVSESSPYGVAEEFLENEARRAVDLNGAAVDVNYPLNPLRGTLFTRKRT